MLRLHFINVGDGDAILVECLENGGAFRLLVDTGRADVGAYPGSQRLTAAEYLRQQGVHRLDALVITHLHTDHFEGLAPLLDTVEVETVLSGFFPCPPVGRIPRTGSEEKTVRGLMDCLEQWAELVDRLGKQGANLRQVDENITLSAPRGLEIQILSPGSAAIRQRQIWAALLAGAEVDQNMVWWSSKFRNPGSLRLQLQYAGRRIELAGDCYGTVWENEAERCDILKVPHHGDAKSLTPLLIRRLQPRYAVISCSAGYIPRKDRPSAAAVSLLEDTGARVWFTDSFPLLGRAPDHWQAANFIIREDGTILPP